MNLTSAWSLLKENLSPTKTAVSDFLGEKAPAPLKPKTSLLGAKTVEQDKDMISSDIYKTPEELNYALDMQRGLPEYQDQLNN